MCYEVGRAYIAIGGERVLGRGAEGPPTQGKAERLTGGVGGGPELQGVGARGYWREGNLMGQWGLVMGWGEAGSDGRTSSPEAELFFAQD